MEQASESSVEGGAIDELLSQSSQDDVGIDGVAESDAGIADRGDATGGGGENGDDSIECAGADRGPNSQEWCEQLVCEVLDLDGRERMLGTTHG